MRNPQPQKLAVFFVAVVGFFTLGLGATCTPVPPLPSTGSCSDACANLAKLGCAEGTTGSCVATCEHTQSSRVTDLKPGCLLAAKTKADARACGSVTCP